MSDRNISLSKVKCFSRIIRCLSQRVEQHVMQNLSASQLASTNTGDVLRLVNKVEKDQEIHSHMLQEQTKLLQTILTLQQHQSEAVRLLLSVEKRIS